MVAPRIERLHFAAVAFCGRVRLCVTPAGVWGSPFGSVAAAKIWLGRAPRRRAHASMVSKRARRRLQDSYNEAAAASTAVRVWGKHRLTRAAALPDAPRPALLREARSQQTRYVVSEKQQPAVSRGARTYAI